MQTVLLLWVLVWTLISFTLMGIDKWKAKRQGRRIPEKTLFLSAILGGSPGAILGMELFRHKTQHKSFRFGLPAILAAQVIAALGLSYWGAFLH